MAAAYPLLEAEPVEQMAQVVKADGSVGSPTQYALKDLFCAH